MDTAAHVSVSEIHATLNLHPCVWLHKIVGFAQVMSVGNIFPAIKESITTQNFAYWLIMLIQCYAKNVTTLYILNYLIVHV